jgi:NAD(P)H-dependent flavin oxidoreductase YrpB (nitropropane dioxygenase family)
VTSGDLAGAVSGAGGLGVIGASFVPPDEVAAMRVDEIFALEPEVLSTAWPRDDQDLGAIFARAHERGCRGMHMVPRVDDAERAVEAGADVIVAQGNEGGGHIGEIGTVVIVRQVAKAVAPVPVLAAGGFVDGAGLVSALALGADGILVGTRFLAADEAPVAPIYKQAIVASDGGDTVVTTLNDSLTGRDWPGAWVRLRRTPFVQRWLGREPELRRRREEAFAQLEQFEASNADDGLMYYGQSAGLIDSVKPAADIVREIVSDAEEILRSRLPTFL